MEVATDRHCQCSFTLELNLKVSKPALTVSHSLLDQRYTATDLTWQPSLPSPRSVPMLHFTRVIKTGIFMTRVKKRDDLFLQHSSYIEAFCVHTLKPVLFQHPTLTIHRRRKVSFPLPTTCLPLSKFLKSAT